MATAYPINPMYLLGLQIDFKEVIPGDHDPVCYSARVVAVQVPCPGTVIEWQLLLERSDVPASQALEYVDLDSLEFRWPEVIPVPVGPQSWH